MALNIKDPATDRVARELAAATGESITDAVRLALTERLQRVQGAARRADRAAGLARYIERGRARAVLDGRTPEEIIGYDEHGLPR